MVKLFVIISIHVFRSDQMSKGFNDVLKFNNDYYVFRSETTNITIKLQNI